jgi:hypothetical protein
MEKAPCRIIQWTFTPRGAAPSGGLDAAARAGSAEPRGELGLGRMKPIGEYPASQLVITAGPLAPVATSLRAASSELADVSALYPRPRSMKSPPRPAAISASGIAYVAIRSREGPASGSREARSVPAAMSMTRRGVSSRSRASIVAFSRTRVRAMSSSISCSGLFPSYEARSSSGTWQPN